MESPIRLYCNSAAMDYISLFTAVVICVQKWERHSIERKESAGEEEVKTQMQGTRSAT